MLIKLNVTRPESTVLQAWFETLRWHYYEHAYFEKDFSHAWGCWLLGRIKGGYSSAFAESDQPFGGRCTLGSGQVRNFEVETKQRCDCCHCVLVRPTLLPTPPSPTAPSCGRQLAKVALIHWVTQCFLPPSVPLLEDNLLEFWKMYHLWMPNYNIQESKSYHLAIHMSTSAVMGGLAFTLYKCEWTKEKSLWFTGWLCAFCRRPISSSQRKRSAEVPLLRPAFLSPLTRWIILRKLNDLALCSQPPLACCQDWCFNSPLDDLID